MSDLTNNMLQRLRDAASPITSADLFAAVAPISQIAFDFELRRLVATNVVERIHSPDGHRYQLRVKRQVATDRVAKAVARAASNGDAPMGTATAPEHALGCSSHSERRFMDTATHTSRVYDVLRSMPKPASNADLCERTEKTTKEVNSALCNLRARGLAVRYGENRNSLWLDVDAPRAVIEMVPANMRSAPHGTPDAVRKHWRQMAAPEAVAAQAKTEAGDAEPINGSAPVAVLVDEIAQRAIKPYQLHSHIATAVLDVDELLGDAIDERATYAVLGHIQRAARELRLALSLAKGA